MRVIARRTLRRYWETNPDAAASLQAWHELTIAAAWSGPAEVRSTFNSVDYVKVSSGRTLLIFNIARNRHRLIADANYETGIVYVLRVMAHQEYDRVKWKKDL